MNRLESKNATGLFIDIGQSFFQAVHGEDVFAFPLERAENGRLTDLCRERLALSLRGFLSQKGRAAGRSAFCAIGARGVSMRRLSLPASSEDELQRVLRLQIESEFPLSPDELAWGSRPIGPPASPANGGPARRELLVVAVKKEVLEEYTGILSECGIVPAFTLAALARAELYPPPSGSCAVLDIGRTHSELMSFDHGVPSSIRILAWGGENITRSIQEKLAVSHDEAEKLKLTLDQPGVASGPQGPLLQTALESALAALAQNSQTRAAGRKTLLDWKKRAQPPHGAAAGRCSGRRGLLRKSGPGARGGAVRSHRRPDQSKRQKQRVPAIAPPIERRAGDSQAGQAAHLEVGRRRRLAGAGHAPFPLRGSRRVQTVPGKETGRFGSRSRPADYD